MFSSKGANKGTNTRGKGKCSYSSPFHSPPLEKPILITLNTFFTHKKLPSVPKCKCCYRTETHISHKGCAHRFKRMFPMLYAKCYLIQCFAQGCQISCNSKVVLQQRQFESLFPTHLAPLAVTI